MGALQPIHLVIILVIVLVLFGGSRLAGLGKSSGRAIREFKEETKDLRGGDKQQSAQTETPRVEGSSTTTTTSTTANGSTVSEPERVEPVERRDA